LDEKEVDDEDKLGDTSQWAAQVRRRRRREEGSPSWVNGEVWRATQAFWGEFKHKLCPSIPPPPPPPPPLDLSLLFINHRLLLPSSQGSSRT